MYRERTERFYFIHIYRFLYYVISPRHVTVYYFRNESFLFILFKVSPKIFGSVLTLCAPGMMSVSVDLAQLRGKGFRAALWGQAVSACDCGEEPARWLSRFLLQEDAGLRLVYYTLDNSSRDARAINKGFPLAEAIDTVSSFPLKV